MNIAISQVQGQFTTAFVFAVQFQELLSKEVPFTDRKPQNGFNNDYDVK